MLIPVKEFFVTAQKTSTFKLFYKGKEAGTFSIDHQYVPKPAPAPPKVEPPKVEEKKPEPPKVVPPKVEEKKVDPPKPAVLPDIPKPQPVVV